MFDKDKKEWLNKECEEFNIECRKVAKSHLLKERRLHHLAKKFNLTLDEVYDLVEYHKDDLRESDVLGYDI